MHRFCFSPIRFNFIAIKIELLGVFFCLSAFSLCPNELELSTSQVNEPAMRTEEASFLASIAKDPTTVRRVFADWLEDKGRPASAEILRLGVEIESLASVEAGRLAYERSTRFESLYPRAVVEWRASAYAETLPGEIHSLTRQGLPILTVNDSAALDLLNSNFVALGIVGLDLSPLAIGISLARKFARLDLQNLLYLNLEGAVTRAQKFQRRVWEDIVSCPMPELRELEISNNQLNEQSRSVLSNWRLAKLEYLAMSATLPDSSATLEFLSGWSLGNLNGFEASGNYLDVAAIELLVRLKMNGLRHLDLSDNALDIFAFEALATWKLPFLRTLKLRANEIEQTAIEELIRWEIALHSLDLGENNINSRATEILVTWNALKSLTALYLDHNRLSTWEFFGLLFNLRQLLHLQLSHNRIGQQWHIPPMGGPSFIHSSLRYLNLGENYLMIGNSINEQFMFSFTNPRFPGLRTLRVGSVALKAVRKFAKQNSRFHRSFSRLRRSKILK